MSSHLRNRYPGIRFFEREEQSLFFGRDEECLDLQSMIKVKPLIVLFAKSGIGKSSLINAGLIPRIEKDHFYTVNIRLQDTSINPVDFVKKALSPYHQAEHYQKHATGKSSKTILWEFVRACHFEREGTPQTPLLIFDQFEEFFNHSISSQKELIHTLADLIHHRLPDEVQQAMRAIPRRQRTKEQLDWFTPVPIKVLLSIRSDRLSLLDELSTEIPTILRDRFHLKPLNIEQAKTAITAPANLEGSHFLVKPFDYDESTLQEMLRHLSNEQEEIESFQLQILCQQIEREVWNRQQNTEA